MERNSLGEFDLRLPIDLRLCRVDDLPKMEWFGMFHAHRNLFEKVYRRYQAGDELMLVADGGDFPVGQIWIALDLAPPLLWGLRVLPPLRGRGIGSWLVTAAEALLGEEHDRVEVACDVDNVRAHRFYRRLGYRQVGERTDRFSYLHPDGYEVHDSAELLVYQKPL